MIFNKLQVNEVSGGGSLPDPTGNAGKFLTTDGTDASWANITKTPSTTPTLTVSGWSSNSQTINVEGVTSTGVVMVGPSPVSVEDYAKAGIVCTSQGNGTLTFTCKNVPEVNLTLNVICL